MKYDCQTRFCSYFCIVFVYMLLASVDQCSSYACTYSVLCYVQCHRLEVDLCKGPCVLLLILLACVASVSVAFFAV